MLDIASLVVQLLPQSKVATCWTKIHKLLPDRAVQAQLRPQRGQPLGGSLHAPHDFDRVASKKLEQEEDQQNHPQQGGKHLPDASQNVRKHILGN
jgi:hypothetical protein